MPALRQKYFPSLFIASLLFGSALAFCQSSTVRFRHISVEQGLSSSQVTSIVQDRKGFLWFGTTQGLNRYDGYDFNVFRHNTNDSTSLSNDLVLSLLAARNGTVWVGTFMGLNRFDEATGTFTRYNFGNSSQTTKGVDDNVFHLAEDGDGAIWAGCRSGLYRVNPKTNQVTAFYHKPNDPGSLSESHVRALYVAENGSLWAGTSNGLDQYIPETGRFEHFMVGHSVFTIKPAGSGRFYAGTFITRPTGKEQPHEAKFGGFYLINPSNPMAPPERSSLIELPLLTDKNDGSAWFKTKGGLVRRFLDGSRQPETFLYSPNNADGLSAEFFDCIFQDREGSIWIGTDNGLNVLTPDNLRFRHFKHRNDDPNSLSHNLVQCVYESRNGIVWLGTKGGGLNSLDPQTGQVQRYPFNAPGSPRSTISGDISRILEDHKGTIWIGTMGMGLDRLDPVSGTFTHRNWNDIRGFVSFFYESRDTTFWIGHQGGLSRYNRDDEDFEFSSYVPEGNDKDALGVVTGILEDHTGAWWVSSNLFSLNQFDPGTKQFRCYMPDPQNPGSICTNHVQAIYEDSKGRLWVGTITGLDRFNRETGTFTHFGAEHGLPDLSVIQLSEDGAGHLWLATGKGIARFDEQTQKFHALDKTDGLSSNESWDFIKSPSTGEFLLATADGLTIFHPDSLRQNELPPPVVFTKFTRYDSKQHLEVEEPGVSGKTTVTLSPNDKIFTVEFAALSYRKTAKNQYAYLLEGFNKNWIPLGGKREVSFTHLDPGTYTLRVKASNGDGVWNETGASLKIIILPPWYRTWWAYLAYAALLSAVVYFIFKMLKNRWLLKMELDMEHREAERLKELDAAKTRLYTNITHEFRTPLTVISGMAEEIREHPSENLGAGVDMIKRNSQYLLRLVNQMLDLRKLEAGKMPLDMVNGDVLPFLRYLLESFHSLASSKYIELRFETSLPELVLDFDPDKLQKIVSNLLSNALKFTPAGGEVTLHAGIACPDLSGRDEGQLVPMYREGMNTGMKDEGRGMISHVGSFLIPHPSSLHSFLVLTISDTGIGIPPEKLPFIFDHFYQVDDTHNRPGEGTGIGLALTRELIRLLGGNISVESEVGKGTSFMVKLPVTNRAKENSASSELMADLEAVGSKILFDPGQAGVGLDGSSKRTAPRHKILIVEDNADVVKYLTTCLQGRYQLQIATNGKTGMEQAIETVPDLIVSDVMMPEMNGFDLCKALKNDDRTSHVPIILLTAKADMDSMLEGLDCGADAYLPKPFESRELTLRIRKLLELREKMQTHYLSLATSHPVHPAKVSLTLTENKENAFVQKIRAIVEMHLDDSRFSTDDLGREVAMSRSQLHRKLTALTGLSPNHFIRIVKLDKARHFLVETDMGIAEIAYSTGFSDPGYFTRVFRQEYGMTPKEWRDGEGLRCK